MTIINLHDELDNAEDVERILSQATEGNQQALVIIGGKPYTVTPPELAKDIIAKEIARRIMESPSLLSDIQKRIESEEPEDWD